MLDVIIAVAIVILLVAGFWWTRGGGGVPGGIGDPAREQLTKYDELGDRTPWDPDSQPEPVAGRPDSADDEAAPKPDPDVEAAAWARERERYRQKNPD